MEFWVTYPLRRINTYTPYKYVIWRIYTDTSYTAYIRRIRHIRRIRIRRRCQNTPYIWRTYFILLKRAHIYPKPYKIRAKYVENTSINNTSIKYVYTLKIYVEIYAVSSFNVYVFIIHFAEVDVSVTPYKYAYKYAVYALKIRGWTYLSTCSHS